MPADRWNPNADQTLGLEWRPYLESNRVIDSATRNAAPRVVSSVTETVDQLIVPHTVSGPSVGLWQQWVDVYDMASSPVAPAVTELTFVPNEDKAKSNVTRSDFGTTTNLYAVMNATDDDPFPEASDYMVNANYGGTATYRCCFDTAAISAGYRIVYVKFEVRAKGFDWSWQKPRIEFNWWNGSTDLGRFATINPEPDYVFRTRQLGPFYFDWYNGGRWLQPEIVTFDNPSLRHLGVKLFYATAISRLTMKVGVVPENRVAVGIASRVTVPPAGLRTNTPMMFKTPLNADNWAKQAAKTYALVVTRCEDPFASTPAFSGAVPLLDSGSANPSGQGDAYDITLAGQDGLVSAVADTVATATIPFVLGTSGGAQSVDSQPYHDLGFHRVDSSKTGLGPSELFTAASGITYSRIKAVVAIDPNAEPTAGLTFGLYRTSDNVQMGGLASITVADLDDSTLATYLGLFGSLEVYAITTTMASASTLTAASYYIAAVSSTGPTRSWYLGYLDTAASHALTGNVTFQGSTGYLYRDGASYTNEDALLTLGSVPTGLTNLSATVQTLTLPANGGSSCPPDDMQYVNLNWASSGLGGSFSRYEVQRSEDGGVTWDAIAYLTDEDDSDFADYEAKRNTPELYRVRVRRTDGAVSDWTTLATPVSVAASTGVLLLVSNADTAIATGYVVLGERQEYTFLDAEQSVYLRMHMRNNQVRFRPLETYGVRWSLRVLVYLTDPEALVDEPPGGAGVRAFDTLRAVGTATIPYVCVLTPWGERLFGAIEITVGEQIEPGHYYAASVTFISTDDGPSAVTI